MERPDLRMPALALAAWGGGLLGALLPAWVTAIVVAAALLAAAIRRSRALAAAALVLAAVAGGTLLRHAQLERAPVAVLADQHAAVTAEAVVTSDPRPTRGVADGVALRVSVREVTGRGTTHSLRAPVLVFGAPSWEDVELGTRVRVVGRALAGGGRRRGRRARRCRRTRDRTAARPLVAGRRHRS